MNPRRDRLTGGGLRRPNGGVCPARRRGAIAVIVLVALILIALIGGTLLKLGTARRAQVQADERRLQAAWLAESGLERAAARLGEDRDYAGETWAVPPGDLGGRHGGRVVIAVTAVESKPGLRKVEARADYPAEAPLSARLRKQVMVNLGRMAPGEGR
jgi:hypothetical protein